MLALGFKQHGGADVMQIFEAPIPKIKPNEVLLEIKASALNRLDLWVRLGWPGLNLDFPHISGSDAAGLIKECGNEVKNLQPGNRVALDPGINLYEDEFTANGENSVSPGYKIIGEHLSGTHTQYIAVAAKNCLRIPDHVDYASAAACGLVGVTAWRMLIRRAKMHLGQKVLVIGAGGGVNSFAIQLAKLAGCEISTITSTEEKMQQAKELGADHIYNYKTDPEWPRKLMKLTYDEGFDIVVDNVGKATLNHSMRLAKRGGKIVIVGNTSGPQTQIDIRYIFSKQIQLIGSTMGNHSDYCKAMQLLFDKKIRPVIQQTYELKEGIKAMEALEQGEHFGKIILQAS